ncbi:hypothetical protein JI747_013825 [Chryseobacterium sp. RG1]|uniref:YD repeat-containing protein n=1 Tax=Chryseobacterium tagetis TaxID=2801334 RepID=A0ABS8A2Q9_9FLAO|nr:hypothetical protein [Chryseobacterium tagetis]MCA6068269.1 hypothetical protein [Chryseobacterium tagetis]
MKKIIFLLTLFCIKIYAQNTTVDIFKPIPTVSYLSTYVDSPVDISTGVPKIDLPGFSLPTKNKNININVNLSYHSKNAGRFQKSSDVGLGWSLMNTNNVISKAVIGGPDEKNANNPLMNMDIFQFNDVYYFNAFGMSGKFIFRKMNDNTFKVQNLGTSKEKIEFTNSPTAYFDILSFKITDEYGNQYFFDKANKVLDRTYSYNHKGAYYLSKVLDPRNQEIISIEYAEYSYIEDNLLSYTDYKPKRIISNGYGEVNLEYDYYPQNRYKSNSTHMSDCYLIKKAELKDPQNKLIQQIDFTYGGLVYYKYSLTNKVTYDTNTLDKITRKNGQGNEIEAYSFTYNSTGTEKDYGPSPNFGFDVCPSDPEPIREWTDNPKYSTIGTLSKMILPTKGFVKFNFESNQYYFNRTSVSNDPLTGPQTIYAHDKETQYYKQIASFNFNTKKNTVFTFNVTPGSTNIPDHRSLILCFQVIGYDPNPLLDPDTIPVIGPMFDNEPIQMTADGYGRIYIPVAMAGQHTITITGNTTGVGNFSVSELTDTDVAQHNYKSKYGARIKSIEYYDSEFSATPSKSKNYVYEKFSDSHASSGNLSPFISFNKSSDFITMYGDTEINKNIIYKNVKEVDADGGYTKYTFFGMDDGYFFQYYNYLEDINNKGLLLSKELFSAAQEKIASENHEYTYENLDADSFIIENAAGYTTLYPVFIKKHKVTNTMYFPQNRTATTFKETLVSKNDFNVEYTKESNDHGDISETYYSYPYSKQLTKLLNKNMFKELIETQTKLNDNLVSKTENRYDDPSHLFPTSVLSQDLQTAAMSAELTYDQYDANGNLLQYTTKEGVVTSIIWGYGGTQPIAKIVGSPYSVAGALAADIVSASDADALDPANEGTLISALDAFRKQPALLTAQISTYTYDPFIGITSITQPSGMRELYLYDATQRLKEIKQQEKDAAGNLIYKTVKEFKYNYKN